MAIEIRDLSFRVRGPDKKDVVILDVPRFDVPDGRQLCLVGGSGSGKTTLLNIIAGITRPTSGSVKVSGADVATLSETARDGFRARTIGYVFQSFNLLQSLTAFENVLVALSFAGVRGEAAKTRAETMLGRVGLSHRLHSKPATMSVGEQQRTAIARALVNHPQVVLADEPTANLDEKNGDDVLKLLREAAADEKSILLLVTHEKRIQESFADVQLLSEIRR